MFIIGRGTSIVKMPGGGVDERTLANPLPSRYHRGMDTNWNDRYVRGDLPWDTNQPSSELQRVLSEYSIQPCRALDIGCGTGTNVVYLAAKDFDATGIDLAPQAIEMAKARAAAARLPCKFAAVDIFNLPDLGGPFDFIFDRGCFHILRQIDEPRAVVVYEQLLSPTGKLLLLAGNANEKPMPEQGPPRVTAEQLCHAFANLRLVHLREIFFDKVNQDYRPLAWSMFARKDG